MSDIPIPTPSSSTSIVTTINTLIDVKIANEKALTINQLLLYKAGSSLVSIDIGTLSH